MSDNETPTYFVGDGIHDRLLLGLAVGLDTRWQRIRKRALARGYSEVEAIAPVIAGIEAAQAIPLEDVPEDVIVALTASRATFDRLNTLVRTLQPSFPEPWGNLLDEGEQDAEDDEDGEDNEATP